MSSSFGRWYDDQRAAEGGAGGLKSSWFSVEQALPLFNTDGLQAYTDGLQNSFETMKQSMEAQMPKKILGMGYQQRFKVGSESVALALTQANRVSQCHSSCISLEILSFPSLGVLCSTVSFCLVFCFSFFRGLAHDGSQASKICPLFYLWKHYFHGKLWHSEGTDGASSKYVYSRSNVLYHYLFWFHVHDLLPDLYQGRYHGLCTRNGCFSSTAASPALVSCQFPARWGHGITISSSSDDNHVATDHRRLLSVAGHLHQQVRQLLRKRVNIPICIILIPRDYVAWSLSRGQIFVSIPSSSH